MSVRLPVVIAVVVFLASLSLTAWFRRIALAHKLLDVPNTRSSHLVATPRGGGVAIVLTTLIAILLLGLFRVLPRSQVWGLGGAGTLVALVGFTDDRGHIAARWRLLGHFIAAAWVLACLGGLPPMGMLTLVVPPWMGNAAAAVYLVWLLNLTNFMDGIDGIAAIESITVCICGVSLYAATVPGMGAGWLPPIILASSTLGFLVWNWPPAKIFMGDVGSGFLGLLFGAFSLEAGWARSTLFWGWVILLGVFIVDATVTLLGRLARGERIYEAHRSHAYQRAARRCGAHRPVTIAVGVINVVWLLPIALLVVRGSMSPQLGVLVAYGPLVTLTLCLGAGKASRT
jgi:Fuc2NAc and GlcNAc transferase